MIFDRHCHDNTHFISYRVPVTEERKRPLCTMESWSLSGRGACARPSLWRHLAAALSGRRGKTDKQHGRQSCCRRGGRADLCCREVGRSSAVTGGSSVSHCGQSLADFQCQLWVVTCHSLSRERLSVVRIEESPPFGRWVTAHGRPLPPDLPDTGTAPRAQMPVINPTNSIGLTNPHSRPPSHVPRRRSPVAL
ncbi:hypothetical protein ThimaDRAFT_0391 [Thiocapsa marina 5811]|uniref:Uncharacterized protein n=1 Tax=Thiocapsa marina 5811 TaxID=768671 RepID=F9U640_9GAMM|nr:hypothetical protein ThimaDRAFT_0391 [Thiocapsa marina 5811]